MPQPPNVDGLPIWLQVTLSLIFAALTAMVAVRGYRTGASEDRQQPKTTLTHIADMGAIRALSDVSRTLCVEILSLTRVITEATHHTRDQNDLLRENAQRLRELRERLDALEAGKRQR